MQIHVSRRGLIWGAVVVLAVIVLVLLLVSTRTSATTAVTGTTTAALTRLHTPSAEEWNRLFLSAPGERTMEDGSIVLTGQATWFQREGSANEIHLRTREGNNYNLVVPDGAYVYHAAEFFSASYPQPTVEDPQGTLMKLKDTPVMVRVKDGQVTTVFILLEVEQ